MVLWHKTTLALLESFEVGMWVSSSPECETSGDGCLACASSHSPQANSPKLLGEGYENEVKTSTVDRILDLVLLTHYH